MLAYRKNIDTLKTVKKQKTDNGYIICNYKKNH